METKLKGMKTVIGLFCCDVLFFLGGKTKRLMIVVLVLCLSGLSQMALAEKVAVMVDSELYPDLTTDINNRFGAIKYNCISIKIWEPVECGRFPNPTGWMTRPVNIDWPWPEGVTFASGSGE